MELVLRVLKWSALAGVLTALVLALKGPLDRRYRAKWRYWLWLALAAAAAEGAPYDYVACCGPEPLMKIVAGMAAEAGVPCEVSLEKRMACGVGACLSCVVDTVDGKKRACVDGPVFDARKVVW